MADDCIFCKIIAGDLPGEIVDSDERTLAFMDINPATPGHSLVVPRAHSADLMEIADGATIPCRLESAAAEFLNAVTGGTDLRIDFIAALQRRAIISAEDAIERPVQFRQRLPAFSRLRRGDIPHHHQTKKYGYKS